MASIQTASPDVGNGGWRTLETPHPPDTKSILTELLNEIVASAFTFILVLDDHHTVDSQEIDSALTFLLEHLPVQMHLVMTTLEQPTLSAIPMETPASKLRVRHGGYDVRSAHSDPNIVFPIERLRVMAQEGRIGELADDAYSFVGACAQTRLIKRTGPKWVELMRSRGIDAMILVPV